MDNRDIMAADPEYRRKVLRIVVLIIVLGLLALSLITPKLDQLAKLQDPEKALKWVTALLVVIFMIPVILTVFIIRIAVMTMKQRQYPPEGIKLLKDTPVLYNEEAKKRAVLMLFLSVLIIDTCVFMAIIAVKLAVSLA